MKWERRGLKAAAGALVAFGSLVGLVLFVVLPAFATSAGGPIPPPSIPKGVTPVDVPTGGQSNDCSVFYANDPADMPAYQYRICVRGHLGETIRAAFPALQAQASGGDTVLTGPLPDRAALYGVLAQIEALGLELLEVRRLPPA